MMDEVPHFTAAVVFRRTGHRSYDDQTTYVHDRSSRER